MIRVIIPALVCTVVIVASGCCGSGQSAAYNDNLFRQQNERFQRQHADHVKQSSDAVRGYLRYRNK